MGGNKCVSVRRINSVAAGELNIKSLTNSSEGQSADSEVDQTVISQQSSTGRLGYHSFDQLVIRHIS